MLQATLPFPDDAVSESRCLQYVLRGADGSSVQDWGNDRASIPLRSSQGEVLIIDSWNRPARRENAFYTEPFQNVLLQPNTHRSPILPRRAQAMLQGPGAALPKGQTLCLMAVARCARTEHRAPLLCDRMPAKIFLFFCAKLTWARGVSIQYKIRVYDVEHANSSAFEDGDNGFCMTAVAPKKNTIVNDGSSGCPRHLERLRAWRSVFSLRSENSFGVGDSPL